MTKIKTLSFLLLISMALNAGLLAWTVGKQTGEIGYQKRQVVAGFIEMARNLPEDKRETALQVIKTRGPELRQAMQDIRKQRQDLYTIMEQEQVDSQAVSNAFAGLRQKTTAAQQVGHEIIVEIIPHASLEQRRSLLQKQKKFFE